MGTEEKAGNAKFSKRRIHSNHSRSDESDEDYTVGEDEEVDDSDEYCSSFIGEESEEGLGEWEEEEEEDRRRKVNRSKGKNGFQVREKSAVGKVRKQSRVSYKEDDDDEDYEDEDYDDDEDEEFTPDEFDLDDEDESVARGKEAGRPPLREKGSIKKRKRKRKGNLKNFSKPIGKRPLKSRVSGKKSVGFNYGRFARKNTAVKGRKKKNPSQRKRRLVVDSDSDFVISESSAHEYTISEEEREQVREGSEFCMNWTHTSKNSSPTNRPPEERELSQQRKRPGKRGQAEKEDANNVLRRLEEDTCELREQPGKKGKEKLENFKNDVGKQVCGICFSEEGKRRVRGTLNCCSHYFCFACIMEWSKVESRCPLCKQRFVTISKPARANAWFDLRTVEIRVPECDQVYQPSEEELRGYLDPYENMICTECQQGGDDALMLLCDLCDSPAHTYCVGLGREVPEGNWYCEGCRPTALCSSSPQAPNPMPVQRTMNINHGLSPVENVRQEIDLNELYVPETPLSQGTGFFSSPGGSGENIQASSHVSGAGASTVSERRRIQRQIQHLLNSRVNEFAGRNRTAAATSEFSGNNILGAQIERSREVAYQPAITQERSATHCTFSHRRSQDNFISSLLHRDFFTVQSQSRGQLIRGPICSSADGFANEMLPPGFAELETHASLRLGYEQLHPYNSRPNDGSDAGISMYGYGEASRTSQGALPKLF